ncbi:MULTISPECIES: DUF418 domain-containing protein [unclassified Janthinobacterium]|uniref:DUF418 domain-containing protein n=1 Tax=unclassified Janthinobacterium TaxID=2610881 RepID=UPI0017DEC4DF|nr:MULTISPECIES: DUF418 domain-containing protein [unclassified Janthinobacterium]MBB5606184.1 uncharacterized protein [Janthinobacterium sp. S3T4]MBB5611944.1 uncharacterized protein [Janthinobacterium sp. S3M3]
MKSKTGRLLQLDVLRGLAVFGILLVNVWGFAWGTLSLRYGTLAPDAPWLDQAAIFFVAAFAELKFYPIFAFLFGAGFALQTRSLKRQLGTWQAAQAAYRRRLRWLLVCGLLHGFLIWSGDVLASYAVAGMLILPLAAARLSRVRNRAWLVAGGFLLFICLLYPVGASLKPQDIAEELQTFANRYATYTQGGLWAVVSLRVRDYSLQLLYAIVMLPHIIALFLLGILAVRFGWLVQPQRHRHVWRWVCVIGLGLGLPFNLLSASATLWQTLYPYQTLFNEPLLGILLFIGGPLLAAAYVAALMLAGPLMRQWLGSWLAPVGRMALTNYLLQSFIGTWLLQGPGLGWAARLSPAGMLGLTMLIMAGQVVLSQYWLRYFKQGPFEALWRRLARLDQSQSKEA